MPKPAYDLFRPNIRSTSVIFASPHSGREYSASFLRRSILDERTIRSSEDAFVDILFGGVPEYGAPLLTARAPRAYLDLNRAPDELDPAVVYGVRSAAHNPRVSSGLGVIPRVVANGRAIYRGKLRQTDVETRIRGYWRPYHETLTSLIDESLGQFSEAILIDCHSMPHEAIENISHPHGHLPDIVLGDRFGAAAAPEIMERVESVFLAAGLNVVRNAPFAGAYMAQHYGRPSRGQHVIQIEIDRALYMDETTIKPNSNFKAFKALLDGVIRDIADIGRVDGRALAAE